MTPTDNLLYFSRRRMWINELKTALACMLIGAAFGALIAIGIIKEFS